MILRALLVALALSVPSASAAPVNNACPVLFKQEKLCASITWIKPSQFTLKFWNANGSETGPYVVPSFPVRVRISMPDMEMDDIPVPVVKPVAGQKGVYSVENVIFTMPGDWEISISGKAKMSLKR